MPTQRRGNHSTVTAAWAPALPVKAGPGRALRSRLLEQVGASAALHAPFRTLRREDGVWLPRAEGGRAWALRDEPAMGVDLVSLEPGEALGWPADAQAQELLVLAGALGSVQERFAYRVLLRASAVEDLRAVGATRVYRRVLRAGLDCVPPLEAQWWGLPSRGWTGPARRRWLAQSAGVEVLPLHGNADVVSMLVRFAPGAGVNDHHHALDEDCLVLDGEMFLGDILLREGDYQLAPAGGSHVGECSERGVTFFFHGALDPVLR